jgi:hypothetical protein
MAGLLPATVIGLPPLLPMPPLVSPTTVSLMSRLLPSAAKNFRSPPAAVPVKVIFAAASAFVVALALPSVASSDAAVTPSPPATPAACEPSAMPLILRVYVPPSDVSMLPKPANRVPEVAVVAALAVTPVSALLALMAAARALALVVVPSVAMALPLMVSEPLAMPFDAVAAPRLAPATPKVPDETVPNWNDSVVAAPLPIWAVVVATPLELRLCACANWLTLTL